VTAADKAKVKDLDKVKNNPDRQSAIAWLVKNNISVLQKGNTYKPGNTVNRGAMAEFMQKLYQKVMIPDVGTIASSGVATNPNTGTASKVLNKGYSYTAYVVTFDSKGGPAVDKQVVAKNGVAKKPTLTRDGYQFEGWFKNSNLTGAAFNFSTKITANTTLYAAWTRIWTVTFDTKGGDCLLACAPQKVLDGSRATEPSVTPVRHNFQFEGWQIQGAEKFDFSTPIKQNITLYAIWERVAFDVTFDLNDGTCDPEDACVGQTIPVGGKVTEPTVAPQKDGWKFVEWQTIDDALLREPYDFKLPVLTDFTLYASYVEVYEVQFNAGEGTCEPAEGCPAQYVVKGEHAVKPLAPTPKDPQNDVFVGWFENDANGFLEFPWDFDNDVVTKELVLFAQYQSKSIEDYTVYFDAAPGKCASSACAQQKVAAGGQATEPNLQPELEGYEFKGWYAQGTGHEKLWNFDNLVNADLNLKAKYEPISGLVWFDVNYDSVDPGTGVDHPGDSGWQIPVEAAFQNVLPPLDGGVTIHRTGYTFAGYFDDKDSGTKYYDADGTRTVDGQNPKPFEEVPEFDEESGEYYFTLFAHWTPIQVDVEFDANAPDDLEATGNQCDAVATFADDLPDLKFLDVETQCISADGSGVGYKVADYEFVGYYDQAIGGNEYYGFFDNAAVKVKDAWDLVPAAPGLAVTLYAHWVETGTVYTVTFNADPGGMQGVVCDKKGQMTDCTDQRVAANHKATAPTDTYFKYLGGTTMTFTGWFYLDGDLEKEWIFDHVVKSDLDLNAKWIHTPVDVTFATNDKGTNPDGFTAAYGLPIGEIPNPTDSDEGYTFTKWEYTGQPSVDYDADTYITVDTGAEYSAPKYTLTLTPIYTAKPVTIIYNLAGKAPNIIPSKGTYGSTTTFTTPTVINTGWAFKEWQNAEGKKVEDSSTTLDAENGVTCQAISCELLLTAEYEAKAVEVTLATDSLGTNPDAPTDVKYGSPIGWNASPTSISDGYVFLGWVYDSEHGITKNYDADTIVTADNGVYDDNNTLKLELTPTYEAISGLVWFDIAYDTPDPGTGVDHPGDSGWQIPVEATYKEALPHLQDGEGMEDQVTIHREGYEFAGYFDAKDGGNQYYDADGTRTVDGQNPKPFEVVPEVDAESGEYYFTLFAHWTPIEVDVEFDANAPEGNNATGTQCDVTQTFGAQLANLKSFANQETECTSASGETVGYEVSNFVFSGYYDQAIGGNEYYGFFESEVVKVKGAWDLVPAAPREAVTLYAHWIPVDTKYTVTFDGDPDNVGNVTCTKESPAQTGDCNNQEVQPNHKATAPTGNYFSRSDTTYTFEGWFYLDGGLEKEWIFDHVVKSDLDLYAKWVHTPVLVSFATDDKGTNPESFTAAYNEPIGEIPNPTDVDSGYMFVKYVNDTTDYSVSTTLVVDGTQYDGNSKKYTLVLTPTYEAKSVTINYDVDEKAEGKTSGVENYGGTFTGYEAPGNVDNGYTFSKWETADGTEFKDDTTLNETNGVTCTTDACELNLKAVYVGKNVSVSFEPSPGSVEYNTGNATYGEALGENLVDATPPHTPADPEYATFVRWYYKDADDKPVGFDADTVVNMENGATFGTEWTLTLYAEYIGAEVLVQLDAGDGYVNPDTIYGTYGLTLDNLKDAQPSGYDVFVGWWYKAQPDCTDNCEFVPFVKGVTELLDDNGVEGNQSDGYTLSLTAFYASPDYVFEITVGGTPQCDNADCTIDSASKATKFKITAPDPAPTPESPTEEFVGWFTDENEGYEWDFDNFYVPADMTLYARFE
jgi:uncharacterized repeat protein (TIGR02543 family)